jgi:HlyD family secretion protein
MVLPRAPEADRCFAPTSKCWPRSWTSCVHSPAASPAERRPSEFVTPVATSRPLSELVSRESARRRRRQLVRRSLAGAVPLLAAVSWLLLRPRPVPFAQRFRTQPAAVGDVIREVTATGNVDAITNVEVGAEISGRIASVDVDYNDRVRAGQVLARFDRTLLSAQRSQTAGALAAAQAALEQARTTLVKAVIDSSRAVQLWASKGITDADRDAALSTTRLTTQAVTAAEAQVSAARAADDVARTNLEHTVIRAPISGVIITRNVDSGQTVASVLQTPVLFTVAADLRKMQVIAAVDEADVGEVSRGQAATFTVDAYPDRVFPGVVTQVRNSPVIVQDVVTYGTVVEVSNADLALKPGMTASVRIRTAAARAVLRVPNAALAFTPPSPAAQPGSVGTAVWVISGDSLRRVAVQTGISDGEFTAVTGGLLTPGSAVVTGLTPQGRAAFGSGR